ncbi:MAG: glucokinase [Piscirickettsiaceae bacterium]|jgi:glucokinase|nr:glucokinase [Piscirickettsiaceae bacterium]
MIEGVLAVDLGGTKVLVQLSTLDGSVVVEQRYQSEQFVDFEAVLMAFFALTTVGDYQLKATCFAVAGPVVGRKASITNLPWQIDADALAEQFPLGKIVLCNDFEAVAYGIDGVKPSSLITLQAGELESLAPRAIIGAGTGLGQAFMFAGQTGWDVVGTEGGNVDFGPNDDEQMALWSYLNQQFGHVSYERILSGSGLVAIYAFLAEQQGETLSTEVKALIGSEDAPALISQLASSGQDRIADAALQLFIRIYGAQAGNLALSVLARGGLYIAGGIAAKNRTYVEEGSFMTSFLSKGKMAALMPLIPVILITDETVGLSGARYLALRSAL